MDLTNQLNTARGKENGARRTDINILRVIFFNVLCVETTAHFNVKKQVTDE